MSIVPLVTGLLSRRRQVADDTREYFQTVGLKNIEEAGMLQRKQVERESIESIEEEKRKQEKELKKEELAQEKLIKELERESKEKIEGEKIKSSEKISDAQIKQKEEAVISNNINNLNKVILQEYLDLNDDKITHGGTNQFSLIQGDINSGKFDKEEINLEEYKKTDFSFQYPKFNNQKPTEFLNQLDTEIANNEEAWVDYYKKNPIDLQELITTFGTAIDAYYLKARTENPSQGLIQTRPNIESQFSNILKIPEFADKFAQINGEYTNKTKALFNSNDVIETKLKVDGVDMIIQEPGEFDASLIGLPKTEEANDKFVKILNYLVKGNTDDYNKNDIKNALMRGDENYIEYAKGLAVALPLGSDLNTFNNLDVVNLHNYLIGEKVTIDGNEFQTDYFLENESRVGDLFLLMSPKKIVTNLGAVVSEQFTLDDQVLDDAVERNSAGNAAMNLADDYLDLLNVAEGYGLPSNAFIRNKFTSLEKIRGGLTSLLDYMSANNMTTGRGFIEENLARLDENFQTLDGALSEGGTAINDGNRLMLIDAMINFTETALAYQVSMAFQGGSGGRTVSNEDFQLVKAAIGQTAGSSYASQRAKLISLKRFLEAPVETSGLIIEHGLQGREAAKLFDRYYNAKSRIFLNSINDLDRETNVSSFTSALKNESQINPKDGLFDTTVVSGNFNFNKDARSRIFRINVPDVGNVLVMTIYKNLLNNNNTNYDIAGNVAYEVLSLNPALTDAENIPVFELINNSPQQINFFRVSDATSGARRAVFENKMNNTLKRENLNEEQINKIMSYVSGSQFRLAFAPIGDGRQFNKIVNNHKFFN